MGSSKNRKEKRANQPTAALARPSPGAKPSTGTGTGTGTASATNQPAASPNHPLSLHIPTLRHLPPSDLLERALSGTDPDLLERLHKVMTTHDVLKHVLAHVPEKDRVGVTAYWLTRDPRHLRASANLATQTQFVRAARTRREAYCSSATCPQCLKEADGLIEDAKKLVARVDLTSVVRGRIESQVEMGIKSKMDADRLAKAAARAAKAAAATAHLPDTTAPAAAKTNPPPAAATNTTTTTTATPVAITTTFTSGAPDLMHPLPSAHAHATLTLRVPMHRMAHRRRARQRLSPRQLQYPHRIASGRPDSDSDSELDDDGQDAAGADPHALLRLASDLTDNHAHQFLSTMQKLTSPGAPAVSVHDGDGTDESALADHILASLTPTGAGTGAAPAGRPLAATHFDPDADSEWLGDDDAWLSCTHLRGAPSLPTVDVRRLADRGVACDWDVFGAAGLYGDAPVVAAGTKAAYPPGAEVGAVNDPVAHAVAWAQVGGRAGAGAAAGPVAKVTYDAKHMHMVPVVCVAEDETGGGEKARVVSAFKTAGSSVAAALAPAAQGKAGKRRHHEAAAATGKGKGHQADDACCEWHHEYTSDEEDDQDGHADDEEDDEHDEIGASESDVGECDHDHDHCDESEEDEDDCHGDDDDDDDDDEDDGQDDDDCEDEEEEEEPGARADDVRSKSSAALPSCATGPVPCGSNCIHHTGSTAKLCARHAKGITYPSPPASDADTSKDRPDASAYLSPASRYTLVSIACEFLAEHVQYQYRQYISERAAQQLLAEERAAEERKADAKRRRAEVHAAKKEAKRLEREAEERKERERIEAEEREREKKEKEREEKRRRQAEAKAKVEAEKLRAREEREKKAEAERAAAEAKRQAKAAAQAAQAAVERAKAEKAESEKREREENERTAKEDKEKREREEREKKEREERDRKEREAAAAVSRKREPSTSKSSAVSSAHSSRKPSVEPVPVSHHPAPPAKAAAQQALKAPPKPTVSRALPVAHDKPVAAVQQPVPVNVTPPSLGVSLPLSPNTARLQLPNSNGSSPSVSMLPVTGAPAASVAGAGRLSSPGPVAGPADHVASSPTVTSTPSTSSSASSSAPNTVLASHHSTLPSPVPSAIGKPPHAATHLHQEQQQQPALPSHPGMSLQQQQQQQQQQMYPPPAAFPYQQALAMGMPMFPGGAPGGNPQQFMYHPAAAAAAAAMAAAAAAAAAASGNPGVQFGMPGMYVPQQQQQQQQFGRSSHVPLPGTQQHQQQHPGDAADYGLAAPSVAGAHSDRVAATSQQLGATSPNVHMPGPALSRESSVHALPQQQFQSPTANGATKYGLGAEAWGVSPIGGSGTGSSSVLPNLSAGASSGGVSNGNSHHSLFDGLRLGTAPDLASTLSTTSSTGGGNGAGTVNSASNSHLPEPINTAMAAASGSASTGNLGSALLSGTSSIWSPFAASDPFDDLRSPTTATASVNSASMAGSRFANLAGVQQAAAATASSTSPPSSATAASATASPWGPPAAVQSPPSTLGSRATAASYRGLGAAALPSGLADALDMDDDLFDPFGFPSKPAAPVQSQFAPPQQQQQQQQQQARAVHLRQQPAAAAGQQYSQHHAHHHGQSNGWTTTDAHHQHQSSAAAFGYAGSASGARAAGQQQAQYTHHQHAHHIQQPPAHQHQPYGHHQQQQQQFARGNSGFPPGSMFVRNQQQVESHTGGY